MKNYKQLRKYIHLLNYRIYFISTGVYTYEYYMLRQYKLMDMYNSKVPSNQTW